jgi:hypothetical protein
MYCDSNTSELGLNVSGVAMAVLYFGQWRCFICERRRDMSGSEGEQYSDISDTNRLDSRELSISPFSELFAVLR